MDYVPTSVYTPKKTKEQKVCSLEKINLISTVTQGFSVYVLKFVGHAFLDKDSVICVLEET